MSSAFCPRRSKRLFLGLGLDPHDDDSFYRDLEEAKKFKLGGQIPKEQLEKAASNAEEEFLAAMKQVRKEFNDAKEKLGAEGAVNLFLEKIRREDENIENDDDIYGEFQ